MLGYRQAYLLSQRNRFTSDPDPAVLARFQDVRVEFGWAVEKAGSLQK